MKKILISALAVVSVALLTGGPIAAAVAPAGDWKAARAAGLIGEQPDGYLGIVGTPTPELRAMVNDVNIQRKSVYTRQSAANDTTVEAFALTAGCNLILNSPAGSKYQAPDGSWKTRSAAPPERDSRCI